MEVIFTVTKSYPTWIEWYLPIELQNVIFYETETPTSTSPISYHDAVLS